MTSNVLIAGCTACYDIHKKHLTIMVFGREAFSGDISGHEEDYWQELEINGRKVDFNFLSNDGGEPPFILVVHPVDGGRTDTSLVQRIPLAFTLADDIENLLRAIHTEELCLSNVDSPATALWWDNHGRPNEGKVLCVGYDERGDLYLKVEDDCGGEVSIWESNNELSEKTLEAIRELVVERMEERRCGECGKPVFEGFIVGGGEEYYCSEECLHRHYSPEEWKEMSRGPEGNGEEGNDSCFWTEWWDA